jgi:protein involved in polysaccharide export with SLBB domain
MRQTFVGFLFFFAFTGGAFGQATLRVGDPLDIKIGGVPAEEQAQINNTYTVDANGSINLPYINKVKAEGLTPIRTSRS